MKLLLNHHLPQMTVRQLQHQLRYPSQRKHKQNHETSQNKHIVVTSPFYQRHKHVHKHNSKCKCHQKSHQFFPYLKKGFDKMGSQQNLVYRFSVPTTESQQNRQNGNLKRKIQKVRLKDIKGYTKNTLNDRMYNGSKQFISDDQNFVQDQEGLFGYDQNYQSLLDGSIPNTIQSRRIDSRNPNFVLYMGKRFENNNFKQKYLKMIFGYMRMKTKKNNQFMKDTRAHVFNHLRVVLNHHTVQQILAFEQLDQQKQKSIANYFQCSIDQAKNICKDFHMSVCSMQSYLEQLKKDQEQRILKKQRQLAQQIQNAKKIKCVTQQNEQLTNQSSSKHRLSMALTSTRKSFALASLKTTSNLGSISKKYLDGVIQSKKDLINQSINKKFQNTVCQSSELNDLANQTNNTDIIRVISQAKNALQNLKNGKKNRKYKKNKSPVNIKLQIPEKYCRIQYQTFIQKQDFIKLISEVDRLDNTDANRAQSIFNSLKVQNFIQDSQKIDKVVKIFSPIFNDRSLVQFMNKVTQLKDQKYLLDLQNQLTKIQEQVKKNDMRHFEQQDFYIPKRKKREPSNLKTFAQIKPFQAKDKLGKIKYFQAHRHIQKFQQERKDRMDLFQLQQTDMQGMKMKCILAKKKSKQIIEESIIQNIQVQEQETGPEVVETIENQKKEQKFIQRGPRFSQQRHKKILRFMRKHHGKTFNQLSNDLSSLCKSLHQETN